MGSEHVMNEENERLLCVIAPACNPRVWGAAAQEIRVDRQGAWAVEPKQASEKGEGGVRREGMSKLKSRICL